MRTGRKARLGGPPLALQIMALLVGGLVVAQLVTLALTLMLPPAPAAQYGLDDIAATLAGASDGGRGRGLQRVLQSGPPDINGPGWLVSEKSRRELAHLMGVEEARVSLTFYTPLPFAGTTAARTLAMADDGFVRPIAFASEGGGLLLRAQYAGPPPGARGVPPAFQPATPPPNGLAPSALRRAGSGEGPRGGILVPRGLTRADGFRPLVSVDRQGQAAVRLPDYGTTAAGGAARPESAAASRVGSQSLVVTTPAGTVVGAVVGTGTSVGGAAAVRIERGAQLAAAGDVPPVLLAPGGGGRIPVLAGGPRIAAPDRLLATPPLAVSAPSPRPAAAPSAAPSPPQRVPVAAASPPPPALPEVALAPPRPSFPPETAMPRPAEAAPAGPPIRVAPARRTFFGLAPAPFVEGDFVAALRIGDGRWAVVQPAPAPFPNAWQRRVLLWFAIALGLVAPLGWLFARRLVKPLDRFAGAAEKLGRDPAAAIGALDGPAEIGRAAYAFNLMQNRLRAFVDDRTAMVGAISHDLRTPLTRMRFRIEDVASDDVRDGLLEEVDAMEAMIARVIDFLRDASAPAPRERLDLRALVEDVVEDARLVGGDVAIEAAAHAQVEVDVLGMRRLLDNLLENAVKYGARARIRLRTDLDEAVAEIIDDGPGLADEEMERVFEPFYRSEDARAGDKAGSGLGLAVCRSIARAHGGDVRLRRLPEGFTAELRVPLVYGSETPVPA